MPHAPQSKRQRATARPSPSRLTKLIYKSRASDQFGPDGLMDLLNTAVERNGREELTGTLVYDRGHFMQWLEGPADALGRVVDSIKFDPRHTDFQVLRARQIEKRAFRDWQMRLAVRKSSPADLPNGTFLADDNQLETLMDYPDAAPSLMRVLFGQDAANLEHPPRSDAPMRDTIETFVTGLGFNPLFGPEGLEDPLLEIPPKIRSCAHELTRLFSAARDESTPRRIEAICRTAARGLDDFVRLYLQTAGEMGDLWHHDLCTEADIAVALSELQIVYSRMRRHGMFQPDRDISDLRIVVAQMPNDLHIVGTILKADILRSRGWDAGTRFPMSQRELVQELRDTHVDALVIATSRVSPSPSSLDQLEELISAVRAGSANQDIVVVVGGRVFSDDPGAWHSVGADASSETPLALSSVLRGLLVD